MFNNYSPANWKFLPKLGVEAYYRECPSLGSLSELYGRDNAAEVWMCVQVSAIFITSGSESDASGEIDAFCTQFAATCGMYKLTELMLFFSRYKAGMYGKSFARFSSRDIGQAFHNEFLPHRRAEMEKAEMQRSAIRASERYNPEEHGGMSSLEYYQKSEAFPIVMRVKKKYSDIVKGIVFVEHEDVNGIVKAVVPKSNMEELVRLSCKGMVTIIQQ